MPEPKINGMPVRVMRASPLKKDSPKHKAILERGIAELKLDGARALVHFCEDKARVYSRTVSEVTGELVENTDSLPHLSCYTSRFVKSNLFFSGIKKWTTLKDTILDGENVVRGSSYDVQTVLGSLPELAIRKQRFGGWITFEAFDCLRYEGQDLIDLPLSVRLHYLSKALKRISNGYIRRVLKCPAGYTPMQWAESLWAQGQEGIIIKDPDSVYSMGKSPANSWLKVKKQQTAEVVVLGYTRAEEESVKVDGTKSVTKYSGQIGAIIYGYSTHKPVSFTTYDELQDQAIKNKPCFIPSAYGILRGRIIDTVSSVHTSAVDTGFVPVGALSGISDELRSKLTKDPHKYLGCVIEIKFQQIFQTKGRKTISFRHPRFVRFRKDKHFKEVTAKSFKPLL
jgi:ATP-dependent DNA ligase